ncbi:MAG: ROK family protein, partial [Actinobacteria bacterium]|nr:ROK family protein [Actinomycetota bacterium]
MTKAAAAALGVDVGGSKVLAVVIDAAGNILRSCRVATPQAAHSRANVLGGPIAEAIAKAIAGCTSSADLPIGIGAPGMVDRQGRLAYAPNLQSATGAELLLVCREILGDRVLVVENDATCAAFAEIQRGALHGVRDGLLITLGTGIGGAVISDGALRRGTQGFAGEFGHMVIDRSGPACPCGSAGCWERYASGAGLARFAHEAAAASQLEKLVAAHGGSVEAIRGEAVVSAARAGDEEAIAVLHTVGWWLALGISNLVAILDPRVVVIGGGLSEIGELLMA